MPKELSHILIAQDVFAELKASGRKRLARIIEKNLPAFYLGAIIPDAFFYDATPLLGLSENNVQIAWALHLKEPVENDARAVSFFDAITADPHEWHAKVTFAAGIVTHTVSDRIIHGVIDHYTRSWGQKGGLAIATHRQLETMMDMVLLQPLRLHPRQFHFGPLVDIHHPTRNILFRFYLSHLTEVHQPVDPRLLRSLNMAYAQQRLCLRLFAVKALYHIMSVSNKLAAGRLGVWSSLFYPDTVGTDGFPIMDRIDPNALTDDRSFAGPLRSVVKEITADAISHIGMGLHRLGQGPRSGDP
ncbi:MAG: hypothetical protein AMK69_01590 [Nitrospira bacterium SG8_3]|nr:MAG: hypothetical protein AMK69_01590 [Nitrospira bacterium SG8_3]